MPTCKVAGCTEPQTGRKTKKYVGLCHGHYARAAIIKVDSKTYLRWSKMFCEVDDCLNLARDFDHWHGHHSFKQQICADCFRGHICRGCNIMIGWAFDDPDLLPDTPRGKAVARYLRSHPKPEE